MQRTRLAQGAQEWEIAYWRLVPYPHWEPIMQSPHSHVTLRMVQQLCEKQPDVHFRLRLCVPASSAAPAFLAWCTAGSDA